MKRMNSKEGMEEIMREVPEPKAPPSISGEFGAQAFEDVTNPEEAFGVDVKRAILGVHSSKDTFISTYYNPLGIKKYETTVRDSRFVCALGCPHLMVVEIYSTEEEARAGHEKIKRWLSDESSLPVAISSVANSVEEFMMFALAGPQILLRASKNTAMVPTAGKHLH